MRIATARPMRRLAILAALFGVAIDTASAVDLSVGAKEIIYTTKQRKAKKLSTWPDGNLGVVANGSGGYEFYGANGTGRVKTSGTLADPARSKTSVTITGVPKKAFDYLSGGPVYMDPGTGARLMIYHAEKHGKSARDFHSVLGLAVSTDPNGVRFRDLGTILEPHLQRGRAEVGGGTFAIVDSHLHVYFRDSYEGGGSSELAVARAPISDVISNALSERGTSFTKYYNGSWSQPGLGGMSSPLEVGNPWNAWAAISHNDYLNQLVMVSAQGTATQPDLYLATSTDGLNWSPRQPLAIDDGEQFYPTLVGMGADPTHTGQSFYVYYTDSKKGAWNRWQDAQLVRRQITLDPYLLPIGPTDPFDPPVDPIVSPPIPGPPQPSPADWVSVAEYGADFQMGSSASGWQYAWNPTGRLGNSTAFAPLTWSNSAQAYNTTGVATPTPGSKNHSDDFLTLTADGGHPGRPGYSAIAGYTIQAEDGAGLYRLADTGIQKSDTILSSNEDGLQMLVYVNDTLLGAAASVATNGLLANFDVELGQLNVGDTIWVAVDPLGTQSYDSFTNFNFAIRKSLPAALALASSASMAHIMNAVTVPEPSSSTLLLLAIVGFLKVRVPRRE